MPYLDGLELIYVPDDNTRVSMLQGGEIDVCMDVPYPLIQALAAQGYRAKAEDTSIIQDMLINHSAEPFNDMKVRQAASFGIDRQAISDAVTLGMGKPASSLMAPDSRLLQHRFAGPGPRRRQGQGAARRSGQAQRHLRADDRRGRSSPTSARRS